jgi:hypothetical protein
MPPRAAYNFIRMVRIPSHPAYDCGHLLATLSLEAFDQVGAIDFIESGVVPIMPFPDTAPGGIDQFVNTRNGIARSQFG